MISVVTQCMLISEEAHLQAFVVVQTVWLHLVFLQMLPVFVKIASLASHSAMFADSTSHG